MSDLSENKRAEDERTKAENGRCLVRSIHLEDPKGALAAANPDDAALGSTERRKSLCLTEREARADRNNCSSDVDMRESSAERVCNTTRLADGKQSAGQGDSCAKEDDN